MPARIPRRTLQLVDGLAQLSFLVQGLLAAHAEDHGLSMVQTRLLAVLRDRRPTMAELAQMLDLDRSSVSGLVDRAQRRGLVRREPAPDDGRSVLVVLTDSGRALIEQVAAQFDAETARLLTPLDAAERATLRELVSRVLVAHAADRGVDLFPSPSGRRAGA